MASLKTLILSGLFALAFGDGKIAAANLRASRDLKATNLLDETVNSKEGKAIYRAGRPSGTGGVPSFRNAPGISRCFHPKCGAFSNFGGFGMDGFHGGFQGGFGMNGFNGGYPGAFGMGGGYGFNQGFGPGGYPGGFGMNGMGGGYGFNSNWGPGGYPGAFGMDGFGFNSNFDGSFGGYPGHHGMFNGPFGRSNDDLRHA